MNNHKLFYEIIQKQLLTQPIELISLTKLRLGTHTLRIQTGKYERKSGTIPVDERKGIQKET